MVMAEVASKKFNWKPEVMEESSLRIFTPDYTVAEEAQTSTLCIRSRFADLPAFGLWAGRIDSDDKLLEELGRGWRKFASE